MEKFIGKNVIIVTKRKKVYDKSLLPIFPEHTFTATIEKICGDFIKINNIKIICYETNNKKYGKNINLLARDKLFERNNFKDFILIKIKNNLYFDVIVNYQNIDLFQSIRETKIFPSLFNISFYKLSTNDLHILNENLIIF